MEAEGSEDGEQELFAGMGTPEDVTESEYEDSGAEQRASTSLGKRKTSPTKPLENLVKKPRIVNWKLPRRYRDLLNKEVCNIVEESTTDDKNTLHLSQIGATVWAVHEKEKFFFALSRYGRDNIKRISSHVKTKSEVEVREYMQLLHSAYLKSRIRARVLELPNFPAAAEIGDECCQQIEAVADAFLVKQEEHEAEIERQKWGDTWLVDHEVSRQLNKRRRETGGSEHIDSVLPAANLFDVDKWLELSQRIFMNPSMPNDDDNWRNLAGEGDLPAIRATALEDFHSLACFITKRLVSTTLFCTMSRLRATKAQKLKHAEITSADVEAAATMLNLPLNSESYWIKCARRCKLRVVDDDVQSEGPQELTWQEVEEELSKKDSHSRSQSRSRSRLHENTTPPVLDEVSVMGIDRADDSDGDQNRSDYSSTAPSVYSDVETGFSRTENAQRETHDRDLEEYTETLDKQTSLTEELNLWKILKTDPPETVIERAQLFASQSPYKPKRILNTFDGQLSWRDHVHFVSEWESLGNGPPEASFQKNQDTWRITREQREYLEQIGTEESDADEEAEDTDFIVDSGDEQGGSKQDYKGYHHAGLGELQNDDFETQFSPNEVGQFDKSASLGMGY